MKKVLIVEDERNAREGLKVILQRDGIEVILCQGGKEAIEVMEAEDIDLLLTDVVMPGVDGIALLEWTLAHRPDTPVVLFTAYGDIDSAVDAIKKGAYDYLTKPLDIPRLENTIKRALEKRGLSLENRRLKETLKKTTLKGVVIGKGEKMRALLAKVTQFAQTDATLLILGETGVGKGLIAKAIHSISPRSSMPFLTVSCSALPETLLESEFFGFEKGAFTGAHSLRKGRFELAEGGTLLLNEVESIPPHLQPKLLRVLEEKEFERIGGIKTIRTDVRVIATANRDLKGLMEEGSFRRDLYYRLNILTIEVPPLRERRDEIPLLAHHFIEDLGRRHKKEIKCITKDAFNILIAYDWPGNVRELRNVMESAVIEAKGPCITTEDLPPSILQMDIPKKEEVMIPLCIPLGEVEKEVILKTLELTGWDKKKTAKLLGIGLKTLYRKISAFKLSY